MRRLPGHLPVNWQTEAYLLALEVNHPVYDCVYLAFAIDLELPLLTADRRLVESDGKQIAQGRRYIQLLETWSTKR